jgi:hypothetical protein
MRERLRRVDPRVRVGASPDSVLSHETGLHRFEDAQHLVPRRLRQYVRDAVRRIGKVKRWGDATGDYVPESPPDRLGRVYLKPASPSYRQEAPIAGGPAERTCSTP